MKRLEIFAIKKLQIAMATILFTFASCASADFVFGTPTNLGPKVNDSRDVMGVCVSRDGLELYFSSNQISGYGGYDLMVSKRESLEHDWTVPVNLGEPSNTRYDAWAPSISTDNLTLYFSDPHSPPFGNVHLGGLGGYDLWQVSIIPVVDFNGDGIVDSADMCIMIDHWGADEPMCDIGPTPFGDGIIDVQDLIVLAAHLFEESGLVARWKLDETEGDVAYDSAGVNDGILNGVPIWQPVNGKVAGALQFDGIDDYVSTEFVLNPADGPFSIFAWVQGGVPGQMAISQSGGANWLRADPASGCLVTELCSSGRSGVPLQSKMEITDGQWHRIGVVWDGLRRVIYVDDLPVTEDTQQGLQGSVGGLNIGCGSVPAAGTFWSGLIDDVRIYNRAVSP